MLYHSVTNPQINFVGLAPTLLRIWARLVYPDPVADFR